MPAKPRRTNAPLTVAQAAARLGVAERLVLGLALTGATRPDARGGGTVELAYAVVGGELEFTTAGVDRFLADCPLPDLVPAAAAAARLGVARPQLTALVYTGVVSSDGAVVKLPVWEVAGGEYVDPRDLDAFALHYRAACERRAAREHAKRYQGRGRKPINL